MNHIAAIIEVLMKRDPEAMLAGLIQYNILKSMLHYVNFPKVLGLFTALLNLTGPKPLLNEIYTVKLIKHLIDSDFFIEISEILLNNKWDFKIGMDIMGNDHNNRIPTDITQIKKDINIDFYPIFEEFSDFSTDIDRIKDPALSKKKLNLIKSTTNKILSIKKMGLLANCFDNDESPKRRKKAVSIGKALESGIIEGPRPKLPSINNIGAINEKISNYQEIKHEPSQSYEQFLIRKDKDLQYLDWERFNTLYPSNSALLRESSLDILSKSPDYSINRLCLLEYEGSFLIEIISFMIRSTIESQNNQKISKLIGLSSRNADIFLSGVLKQRFFNNLFKSFLLKAKLVIKEPINSNIALGETINLVLKNCSRYKWKGMVSNTCQKHFMFLQKTIMNSYTWPLGGKFKVIRVLLIEQLALIMDNEGNRVIDEILEGLWDILIKYLLEFKQQSLFQRYLLDIIEIVLRNKNQRSIMIIFIKMNLLNILYCDILKVIKNEVIIATSPMDTFFFFCKSLVQSLENCFSDNKFPLLSQITTLISWKALKKKFEKSDFSSSDYKGNNPKLKAFIKNEISEKSSEKKKTSMTSSKGFGSMKKTLSTVFLTSPKMTITSIRTQGSIEFVGSSKWKSMHSKSKTIVMGNKKGL